MSVATETALSIDTIEEKLSALGYETEYYGDDEGTTFTITVGDKEITLFDAVSGDSFRPENLSSALYYFGIMGKDVTRAFEDADTIDGFLYAVQDTMTVNFMPR
jgi:hypothetical protein